HVAIAYDTRFLSYKYAELIAEVLTGNNIKCYMTERDVPEVCLMACVKNLKCSSGIMITAGNKNYSYNGIKFIPDYAGPAMSHISMEIERNIRLISDMEEEIEYKNYDQALALSQVEPVDMIQEYNKLVEKKIEFKKLKENGLKIVIDCINGPIRGVFHKILGKSSDIIEINSDYNPAFSERTPDPEKDNLESLSETVKNSEADLGVAFDSSGDRISFIDKNGNRLNRDVLLGIVLEYILKTKGKNGVVAKTTCTSNIIDKICVTNGVELIETYTGFKHITEKVIKGKILFGCDHSGGYTFSEYIPYRDSILFLLCIIEIMNVTDKSIIELSEEFTEIHGQYFSSKINIRVRDEEEKMRILGKIKNIGVLFEKNSIKDQIQKDGYKILFNDNSFILIIAHPLVSEFSVFIECNEKATLNTMEKQIRKFFDE
ncbi:MAG: hypothetical protein M0R46_05835, partial [Candidatus Muirbacterium halophilum]|nr:hypothetical protein [Candidatus Muirbacterium halophilum]